MKKVSVPAFWADEVIVEIDPDDGTVFLNGRVIGQVRRGTRTYSPPAWKGARIVKYHKQVPEWHGWKPDRATYRSPDYRGDTRTRVLQQMVRDAG